MYCSHRDAKEQVSPYTLNARYSVYCIVVYYSRSFTCSSPSLLLPPSTSKSTVEINILSIEIKEKILLYLKSLPRRVRKGVRRSLRSTNSRLMHSCLLNPRLRAAQRIVRTCWTCPSKPPCPMTAPFSSSWNRRCARTLGKERRVSSFGRLRYSPQ